MSQVPSSGLRRRSRSGYSIPVNPARVTVDDCIKPTSRSITTRLMDYIDGTCSTMIDGERVEIAGAHPKDLNHDVAVHVRGTEAALDGWSVPPIMLGFGGLLAAGAVAATARRLTQRGP